MSSVNNNYTNTGVNTNSNVKDKNSVASQKDMFLKILTTQLQNQNPLEPVKPQEFTSQLTQYSQLEQQMQMNENLKSLLAASGKTQVSPLSYLNTSVDYYSDTAPVQDGAATWTYSATDADKITLRVEDANGQVVYSGEGDITSGAHNFSLPSDLKSGTPLKLVVIASKENKSVETTINARAKITAVNTLDGTTILEADGLFLASDLVTRVATIKPTTTNNS